MRSALLVHSEAVWLSFEAEYALILDTTPRRCRCGMGCRSGLHAGRRRPVPANRSRSHDAVIRVYDDAGNVIETHEHKGDFKEW